MCGIAGILRTAPTAAMRDEVSRMIGRVAHRGPDGEGIHVQDRVAIAHRRLSIIDLAGGGQPMSNEDGTVWITYNGELYNYRELRRELLAAGHVFRTQSDTETIVHAYEQWGADCVTRFRGMFAFAIVDYRQRQVFLARDHFGIKPLYYRVGDGYFGFASELPALREVDDAVPAGNIRAVDYFLRFGYIPDPETIYQDTFKLPPASRMTIAFDGQRTPAERYWQLEFQPDHSLDDVEWERLCEATIRESVEAHLVSDVPFGVFLSGGIDSTLVACLMSEILGPGVEAFSIGFDETPYSEIKYAEKAAKQCGIHLNAEIVKPDVQLVLELAQHYGEPFGDSSNLPTWYLSRLTHSQVPMVLSGDGGDEFFAGYHRYRWWMNSYLPPRELIHLARFPRNLALNPLRSSKIVGSVVGRSGIARRSVGWQESIRVFATVGYQRLWKPSFHEQLFPSAPTFHDAALTGERFDRLAFAQHVDINTYLPGDILTKVDRASMYHGLEVRTPLIDVEVAKLAATLPMNQRIRHCNGHGRVLKYLPKRLLEQRFSDDFVHRRKMGFGIPEHEWLCDDAALGHLVHDCLLRDQARIHELLDQREIAHIVASLAGNPKRRRMVWLLMILGIWLDANPEVSFAPAGSVSHA